MGVLQDYILASPNADAFEKVTGSPRTYRKEVVYLGNFIKRDPKSGSVQFELPVDETLLDHWVATFKKMQAEGIDVPVPLEHTADPEKNRGKVIKLTKEQNPHREGPSLYAYIQFRDAESEKMAASSQVSLYSPPEFVSGKDTKYVRPIRHVALTDYPLIPGLANFEKAVVASLVSNSEEDEMTVRELASRLGVDISASASDEEIVQTFETWSAEMEEEGTTTESEDLDFEDDDFEEFDDEDGTTTESEETFDEFEPDDDEFDAEDDFGDDDDSFDEAVDEDFSVTTTESEEMSASLSPRVLNEIVRARKFELSSMCKERKITPAQRDRLIKRFADPRRVAIAMSDSSEDDGYSDTVETLKMNREAFKTSSSTGPQALPGDSPQSSPMVRDAEKRASQQSN